MIQTCRHTGVQFEVSEEDLRFYERISPVFQGKKYLIPPPTLCPEERQRRRLAFRNERKLSIRSSAMSGKQIITMYSPEKLFPVYNQEEWWGDHWDARTYGKEFDFSRRFFEQFQELFQKVPRISLINKEHENSEYCNFSI